MNQQKWFDAAHHKQSGLAPIAIILIIAGVLVLGAGAYYWQKSRVAAPAQIACPMDAKICSDGSSVGRTGPNCEFKACPIATSTATSTITVLSPNGGEAWQSGSQHIITWNTNVADKILSAPYVILELLSEIKGYVGEITILNSTAIKSGSYIWTTGRAISGSGPQFDAQPGKYYVQIRTVIDGKEISDTSDAPFSIFISENIQTVTVQDLIKHPEQFLGKEVRVSGKLMLTSKSYFPNPEVGISDGINIFPVSQWLPTEIPPSPPNQGNANQPVTMQYYLNKNLTLRGIVKSGDIYPERGVIMYLDVTTVE